jgi:ferredoxin
MLVLTLIFGRFFCGWICPLGALIDFMEWVFQKQPAKKKHRFDPQLLSQAKFGVLVLVLTASLASVQWIYFFDPIVIMTRFVGMVMIPVERTLKGGAPFSVLHAEQFILFVAGILLLSAVARRFWCRFVCPLGALFGLVGRFAIFDFRQEGCKTCPRCQKRCPTGAIATPKPEDFKPSECIRCFNCLDACHISVRDFGPHLRTPRRYAPIQMPRRTFMAWFAGGLAGSSVLASRALGRPHEKTLLRPPFAADERAFLDLCVRCQACVNVCPSNALQPFLLQSGLYGLWSPGLLPAVGACQVDCNRCSLVCPTGAIGTFDIRSKYTLKMGTANLVKSHCVSWADNKPCGKCIPKCPTGAISFYEKGGLRLPAKVDFLLCVGCGICENVCHQQTFGPVALIVTAQGRNQVSGVNVDHLIKQLKESEHDAH